MAVATINPASGAVLRTFEAIFDLQSEEKLQRAVCASSRFRKTTFPRRAAMTVKAAAILEADEENPARVMTTEMAKTNRAAVGELTGLKRLNQPGNHCLPTLLANISKGSPTACGELFGPVASLSRVKNAEDAIRVANASPFGLGASAWTNDSEEREKFIHGLESGMVFINPRGGVGPAAAARRSEAVGPGAGTGEV
jgi:acyl-CoA reductase-like NAD-dependent aldehyde dehydrogenase